VGGAARHADTQERESIRQMLATISYQTSIRLAEVGFLLVLIAGVWIVAAEVPQLKIARTRMNAAGTLLAVAGLLLIVPIHWGTFG
jgi:hypothetical protein